MQNRLSMNSQQVEGLSGNETIFESKNRVLEFIIIYSQYKRTCKSGRGCSARAPLTT